MLTYINFPALDQKLVEWLKGQGYVVFQQIFGNQPMLGVPVKDVEEVVDVLRERFERKLEMLLSDYDSFNENKNLDELYTFLRYNFRLKNYLAMRAAIDTSCLIDDRAYMELKEAIGAVLDLK